MNLVKVNFIFDNVISTIQCSKENKIGYLCQEYANKIGKDIDSLIFLNEEYQINFELNLENYINSKNIKNEIDILVYKTEKLNNKKMNKSSSEEKLNNAFVIKNNNIINSDKIDSNIENKNNASIKKNEINLNTKYFANINSKYIIKIIFSYMEEKIKLKAVRHNKTLQNKLNIEFINYKLFSGRYIYYNNDGTVAEYDNEDNLVFEGEYLNGERNGKGKEYFQNKAIKFEGEYKNGMKNGQGKEYYWRDKIKFEGEYLNGKKWNGKMYDLEEEDKIYEIKNGKGFIVDYCFLNNNLKYEGDYLNGKGKIYKHDKLIFEGEFKNEKKWNGIGYDKNGNIIYEIKEGKGLFKEYHEERRFSMENKNEKNYELKLEGEYKFGELNGKVKQYDIDGDLELEGEYINGQLNGLVKCYYIRLRFDGEYLYNYKLRGTEYIENRLEFEGDYLFDKKWNGNGYDKNGNIIYTLTNGTGKVKLYDKKGRIEYEGEYLNGIINGKGKQYYKGHLIYDGEFLKGKKNGKGIEYDDYGKVLFEGEYLDDKKWNGKGKERKGRVKFEGEIKNGRRWNGSGRYTGCSIAYNRFLITYKDGKEIIKSFK